MSEIIIPDWVINRDKSLDGNVCPECPHTYFTHIAFPHAGGCHDCPCTRTYESLVGEKPNVTLDEYFKLMASTVLKPSECGCRSWDAFEREFKSHHDNCDGFGNLRYKTCPCQQWKGNWIQGHHPNCDGHGKPKTHFVTGLSVAEPELQLLVIDMGNMAVGKVEKGEWARHKQGSLIYGWGSFDALKVAIDQAPVPRIERGNDGSYRLFDCNDKFGHELCEDAFRVYQETVGKPLPIYEGGTWEELIALQKKGEGGWIDDRELTVWRYKRNERLHRDE